MSNQRGFKYDEIFVIMEECIVFFLLNNNHWFYSQYKGPRNTESFAGAPATTAREERQR